MTAASVRESRGLDALNLLVAGSQTGFGPFVAVYLTSQAWTQAHIGEALSLGMAVMMLSQLPAGALVDLMRSKRLAVALGGAAVAASALLLGASPTPVSVLAAEILHGFASSLIGPAIAALSVAAAGWTGLGERLGRNARFASLGGAGAAILLGWVGTYVSGRAVFAVTAALMLLGLLAVPFLRSGATPAMPRTAPVLSRRDGYLRTLLDKRLLRFAACVALFQLANAAMLPLVAGELTRANGASANLVIAACVVAPQALVALFSPWIGRMADRVGRRPLLLIGFAAVPVRGALLAAAGTDPLLVVPVQALDGVSAAALGVLLPLVAADLAQGRGGFNLRIGFLGLAAGVGATLSTILAGWAAQRLGPGGTLLALAAAGAVAIPGVWILGETRSPIAATPSRCVRRQSS